MLQTGVQDAKPGCHVSQELVCEKSVNENVVPAAGVTRTFDGKSQVDIRFM